MKKQILSFISSLKMSSIFQLTSGAIIAQLITVIVSPISTRLYTPAELGIYTLLITVIAMFGPVLCGKYDLSIVTAENESEVMELIVGSIFFSTIYILLISAGYMIYLNKNPDITDSLGGFAYFTLIILFITGLTNILTSYNNRHKEYKTISSVYIIRAVVQNIGLVIFGILNLGSIGLLLSQFFSSLSGLKKQSENLYRNRVIFKNISITEVRKTLSKYKKQPFFSMPAHFVNSTAYSLLNFFISGLFGLDIFGYYSMSFRILGLPLSLISMNVSKIFFQKATEEKRLFGNYKNTFKRTTLFLTLLSIPMVLILMFFGPFLFEYIFGKGWYISGVFVRILAPMYGIRFVVSALTPAMIVSGHQKFELILQSFFVGSSVLSFTVCKYFDFDINFFLIMISVINSLIYIILFVYIYRLSKEKL